MPGAPAEVITLLRQAQILHRQGLLNEAERFYRDLLSRFPQQPDALHFLGVLEAQRGRYESAIGLMTRALGQTPRNPALLYNRANALRDAGRLDEALAGYDASLAAKPGNFAVLNNRGAVLQALGRQKEALASFDRAIREKPDHADSHANRGNSLMALQRPEDALQSFERAIGLAPDHPPALYGRGNALAGLNRDEDAVAAYDAALRRAPGNSEILNNRGNVLCRLARYEEAIANFDGAIAGAPASAEALGNRGNALMMLRRFDEALASFERALVLDPRYAGALYGRGSALIELKRQDDAVPALRELLKQQPDYPYAAGMLVFAQMICCDWTAPEDAQALIQAVRAGGRAATPLALLAVSDSPADKLACARIVMRDKFPQSPTALWRGERYGHDRIRLAYLSADFGSHPVAVQLAGVLESHDRAAFETIAIAHGPDDGSEMRARIARAVDRFVVVEGESDEDVAKALREMEIDIAIDLTGLTAGGRPGILVHRPAPVQVSFLGFAASHGSNHLDYILADRCVIPEEQSAFYDEKVVYLPDCYMPHDHGIGAAEAMPSRAAMGLPERGFVFACFNNSYKFAPATFDIWMRLLGQVEGSVLWLGAASASAMGNLRREAEARGVAGSRIVFAGRVERREDHLARLGLAQLFLDTLPYNAHSTACDALWAGLPVLTCRGSSFAGRAAASMLDAAGLPEMVTESLEAYEALALALARNPEALRVIAAKLARNRQSCALFDTRRFTRKLEAAFITMRQRAEDGLMPEGFAVAGHEVHQAS